MNIDDCFEKAQSCELCYGGKPICVPLPDPKNGKENVDIMFINERPGRVGTGYSGYVSFDNVTVPVAASESVLFLRSASQHPPSCVPASVKIRWLENR